MGELICNMIRTEKGTHVLFRDFGLSGVDSETTITRTSIQNEVSKWYPDVLIKSCTSQGDVNGQFEIAIEVEGE